VALGEVARARFGAVALLLIVALASGCADKRVSLRYAPGPAQPPIPDARAVTVFPFDDRRGSEGDQDPNRVGGVYYRYGNRIAKVMTETPFARTLADALASGLKARGVPAVVSAEPRYRAGASTVTTPFVLTGEVHDFSTEARYTTSGHVSGVVRLYDRTGRLVLERQFSERDREGIRLGGFAASTKRLEDALNNTFAKFVSRVVNDPDLSAALAGGRKSP